jgi:hypothetical protein
MPIVIAIVLGPLIAGLAVCLFTTIVAIFNQTDALGFVDLLRVLVPMFGFYIAVAYMAGWQIALLAGLLVSIWMIWRPPTLFVAMAAAVIATSGYMAVGAVGLLGPEELINARSNFLFTLVLAVIAAAVCWVLTRRFVTAPGAMPNKLIS